MKNLFGIMQGRLLPKYKYRYQAHPVGYWQDEFELAKRAGLDCIEFILDFNDAETNPLLKPDGAGEILNTCEQTGVSVKTICADYFMEAPLHGEDESVVDKSLEVLKALLQISAEIGVSDIVIPCVDQSTLSDTAAVDRFVQSMNKIIPELEATRINLSLETDLAPQPFVYLLDKINSKWVRVNYDIGNSAAMGYDPIEELDAYGVRISDIHIKDRLLGGDSVILGEGNADFELFFNKLKEFDYNGPFIMQAYRDNQGVDVFNRQWSWILDMLQKVNYV